MSRRHVHRANARSGAAKVMPGGIAGRVRFGFHDAAADAAFREIVDHHFADEKTRQRYGVLRQFFAAELTECHGRNRFYYLRAWPRGEFGLGVGAIKLAPRHRTSTRTHGSGFSGGSALKRRASSACSITTAGSRWIASKYFFWKTSPDSVGMNILRARVMAVAASAGTTGISPARVSSIRTTNSEMLCSQANWACPTTRRKSSPALTTPLARS